MTLTRVVIIADFDPIREDGTDVTIGNVGDQHWLDALDMGVKFGIGDALHLSRPVDVVESLVTSVDHEQVWIINPAVPRAGLKISGR